MSTPNRTPLDPYDALGYLLKHAAARFVAATDAALEHHEIDGKDLGVLRVLAQRELTSQLELGEALGIDRTTMVALLDGLERKGVVARRPDPADRRRNVAELTAQGREIFDAAEADYLSTEKAFLSSLEPAAREPFRRALRTLVTEAPSESPA